MGDKIPLMTYEMNIEQLKLDVLMDFRADFLEAVRRNEAVLECGAQGIIDEFFREFTSLVVAQDRRTRSVR